jgi:hypothetical protein
VSDEVTLANEGTGIAIVPRGGRVQSVRDRRSGRELLHQRRAPDPQGEFLEASTGGWDVMFPNDAPWDGHPDHGRVWAASFETIRSGTDSVLLATTLERPAVEIQRDYRLLAAPRTGLRVETGLRALENTGPFLWACHVMVGVEPGWFVAADGAPLRVDPALPGRFEKGERGPIAGPVIPEPGLGWVEVLYADGATRALAQSPDGRHRTALSWDGDELGHLWIVTVTGDAGLDLALVLEPSTSATWDIERAVAQGSGGSLSEGSSRRGWVELESKDL